MSAYLVPGLLAVVCIAALRKRENAYDLLLSGAAEGLQLLITLIPTLILLLTAVTMLRASGAMEQISQFFSLLSDGDRRVRIDVYACVPVDDVLLHLEVLY